MQSSGYITIISKLHCVLKYTVWPVQTMQMVNYVSVCIIHAESRAVLVVVESPDHSNTRYKRLTIGQLSVLPHHRLSDIELLIADLLSRYCESLRGHSLLTPLERLPQTEAEQASIIDVGKSLSERIQSECELADALNNGDSVLKHNYLQNCSKSIKSICARISSLDLDSDNVACYRVGSYEWRHGTLDTGVGGKTLLSVLSETQPAQVGITLRGEDLELF